jgi:hypothetical protein
MAVEVRAVLAEARVGVGDRTYDWIEEWARLPKTDAGRTAWPHTGMVVTSKDEIVTFEAAGSQLIVLDTEGNLLRSIPVDIEEAHGITLAVEDGQDVLWLTDASRKRSPTSDYNASDDDTSSKVIKVDLDGHIRMTIARPPHPGYEKGKYRPTCVAIDEDRFGGSGDIWIGDGYGESYVHHYNREGRYRGSLSGEEGAGRFSNPHAVFIDRRRLVPELYVADRANARIQVYGLDGRFRRVVAGFLSRPTWFARDGERLILVEFTPPRLTVLDAEDRLIGYLAEGPVIIDRPGWPNELDADGKPVRPRLVPGKLNSPHTLAIDSGGSIYVSEYLIGARMLRLRRLS